ncbi:MAG: ABC transporter permease, partial [Cyclobacteriaceae bacterium]|nr:ABC transporter permease [Cyclobacteriaceae bacterium]
MLKNYIVTAFRTIKKQRFFAVINILGLTVGIAASLYISLYVYDEFNYDDFHKNGDRIYHMGINAKIAGQEVKATSTPARMAGAMRTEIPAIEAITVFDDWQDVIFRYEEKVIVEEKVFLADSGFFKVFTFPLLEGDAKTALKEPNSVVITEEMSKKYFGNESPIGKMLSMGRDKKALKVTGLAQNPPTNSNAQFSALISFYTFPDRLEDHWLNNSYHTYYMIKEGTTIVEVDEQVEVLINKYVSPVLKQLMGGTLEEMRAQGGEFGYISEPMLDIHLHSTLEDNLTPTTNIAYIYILLAIGAFILIIACINFMNLSTAKASKRAKEIGLRKTMGSTRGQLVGQFLIESIIYSLIATLLAVVIIYVSLPSLNIISGKVLVLEALFQPQFLMMALGLILFVGLMAG